MDGPKGATVDFFTGHYSYYKYLWYLFKNFLISVTEQNQLFTWRGGTKIISPLINQGAILLFEVTHDYPTGNII